eukprot:4582-Heterococcus_DN1.PRE.5
MSPSTAAGRACVLKAGYAWRVLLRSASSTRWSSRGRNSCTPSAWSARVVVLPLLAAHCCSRSAAVAPTSAMHHRSAHIGAQRQTSHWKARNSAPLDAEQQMADASTLEC